MRVYVTVDVECSLPSLSKGGEPRPVGTRERVYGDFGGRRLGIPLIMDMLDAHGFRGTFFCDSCMRYLVGEDEAGKVLSDISARGHDVQLHIHPIFRLWATRNTGSLISRDRWSDDIGALPISLQDDLIKEGRCFVRDYTSRAPTVFRAGNYGAGDATLELLAVNGFLADSSYNLWAQVTAGYSKRIVTSDPINIPFRHCGVVEFPVTCFLAPTAGAEGYRFFAPEGAAYREMQAALQRLAAVGVQDVVVVLHSFSFIKPADPNYRSARFNWVAHERFRRLLQLLASRPDEYEVVSLGDYVERRDAPPLGTASARHFVSVPAWTVGLRLTGQVAQRLI